MTLRFDVVEVAVADMGRALAFYRLLGMDATLHDPDGNAVDLFAPLPAG